MITGREWVDKHIHLGHNRPAVMKAVLESVKNGEHVPWPMQAITVGDVTFFAATDYFSIGTSVDFVRVPLDPATATTIADELGYFPMPTSKMVDYIWDTADVRLDPRPWGPPYDSSMMTVKRFSDHNSIIEKQLIDVAEKYEIMRIVAGHKKDIVLSDRLLSRPGYCAIYGWHRADGRPIQGPTVHTGHIASYYDYSHGWRPIGKTVKINGFEVPMIEFLSDHESCKILHSEVQPNGSIDDTPLLCLRFPPPEHAQPKPAQPPPTAPTGGSPDSTHADTFKQARNYRQTNGRKIDLVVIHTMEAQEKPQTAENVASWFAGPQAPMASAHYNVDADSIVQSVREKDVAFHVPGANHNGIGIEHAGYARQTEQQWDDVYSVEMLERSAKLCADLCNRYSIPVEFVNKEGLVAGRRGITFHSEVSLAFRKSTHMDPGNNFPLDKYLAMVKAEL